MLSLAQANMMDKILSNFSQSLTAWHFLAALVLLVLSLYILFTRKTTLALLMVFCLSLITTVSSPAVASGAAIGRWYFLALAAVCALQRPGACSGYFLGLIAIWTGINLIGVMFAPDKTMAIVRAAYFVLAIPAYMLSMGPPGQSPDTLIRFLRGGALAGVVLAGLHFFFIVVAPQGGGINRFTSFFLAPQPMSLATGSITLMMIWALLSRNAGRFWLIILLGALANIVVMVASTQRAGIFSLAGGVLLMMAFYRGRGAMIALIAGGAPALAMGPLIGNVISENFLKERMGSLDTSGRSEYWALGVRESLKSPIVGHGSGAATYFSGMVFGVKFHQAYIATMFDFGLPGLAFFLLMIGSALVMAFRIARRKTPKISSLGVFCFGAMAMRAQGLVETGISDTLNQTASLFYIVIGMVGALQPMRETAPAQEMALKWHRFAP